jgi:hypothetical protein
MGRKGGGDKAGAGKAQKWQASGRAGKGSGNKGCETSGQQSGPTVKVKSGAIDISQKNAARIRDLVQVVPASEHQRR